MTIKSRIARLEKDATNDTQPGIADMLREARLRRESMTPEELAAHEVQLVARYGTASYPTRDTSIAARLWRARMRRLGHTGQ